MFWSNIIPSTKQNLLHKKGAHFVSQFSHSRVISMDTKCKLVIKDTKQCVFTHNKRLHCCSAWDVQTCQPLWTMRNALCILKYLPRL